MAKRLRSLASRLWDTDDVDVTLRTSTTSVTSHRDASLHELQLENESLRQRIDNLLAEVQELTARATPSLPPQNRISEVGACFKEPWLEALGADVVHLPRLQDEILPQLLDSGYCNVKLTFEIPKNPRASASHVMRHVENAVSKLSCKHPAVFKIGISANPVLRWNHTVYGYARCRREKWQGMKVIAVTAHSFSAALLESVLISKFRGTPGCRNESPGGETANPGDGPHFTYVVYKILVPPPRVIGSGAPSLQI